MKKCRRLAIVAAIAAACVNAGCRRDTPVKPAEPQIIWRPVGSWSGRGNSQTDSFTSDSGALRVRWQTTTIPGAPADARFHLTAHSAISGRVLDEVVDAPGAGSGVGYVSQDPHVFYMSVEASGVAWTFSVEEGIAGEIVGSPRR